MNIALIGFGKVSYNLFKLIDSPDINFSTSTEGRSQKTVDLINESNIEVFDSFREAVEKSDIVISAVTPSQALDVSRRYAQDFKGLYLDLNNVSPDTKNRINDVCENFVDGAVIGKIDSDNPTLFLSGKNTDKLLFLNDFLNVWSV